MWKVILGAVLGGVIGCGMGIGVALAMPHLQIPTERGWTSYPLESKGLYDARPPSLDDLPLAYRLFHGVLLGTGFGSVVGSIAGAAREICRAVKSQPSSAAPPKT